jgi:hypothetical protein
MPFAAPLLALAFVAPEPGSERGVVEVAAAAEVLYPPSVKDPRTHPGYGVAVSASVHAESQFKAMFGVGFDHIVSGWAGDPEKGEPAEGGRFAGTVPATYRGQFFRISPLVRLGLENEVAFGYFGMAPGYVLRVADLSCARGPCGTRRAVDHGLNLGISLGAMFQPSMKFGLMLGGEVGLDWGWFPQGQPSLAQWSQGMSARIIAGWRF